MMVAKMDDFEKLPKNVLETIFSQLTKSDVESLSQTSSFLYRATQETLRRSITVFPRSERDLCHIDQTNLLDPPMHHTTHLGFESQIRHVKSRRCCIHEQESREPWHPQRARSGGTIHGHGNDDSGFVPLKDQALALFERLRMGQLKSFSWNMGCCVPGEILGTNGSLPLHQTQLQSLKLVTDCTCPLSSQEDCTMDLSSFHQLRKLSWTGPTANHLETLWAAIQNNAHQLQELELHLFHSRHQQQQQHHHQHTLDQKQYGPSQANPFETLMMSLTHHAPPPMFQNLRVLALSEALLSAETASQLNFEVLESLVLRKCHGWDQLLDQVVWLKLPVRLRKLEIQDSEEISDGMGEYTIAKFLNAFSGLESLCLSLPGPVSTLDLWRSALAHRATLKRLAQHQRAVKLSGRSRHGHKEVDLSNLGIVSSDMRMLQVDLSKNPLMGFDLECIGISCRPELAKPILEPFRHKTTLKMLHIRQSSSDSHHNSSWAVKQDSPSFQSHKADLGQNAKARGRDSPAHLRSEFVQFANWIFGSDGVASLQVIAYGDFTFGAGYGKHNLFLCRNALGGYQMVVEHDGGFQEVWDSYRPFLESCPSEPYLRCSSD